MRRRGEEAADSLLGLGDIASEAGEAVLVFEGKALERVDGLMEARLGRLLRARAPS